MDKLVVSGGITAALGIGFLVVHSVYPMLSDTLRLRRNRRHNNRNGIIIWVKDLEQRRVSSN